MHPLGRASACVYACMYVCVCVCSQKMTHTHMQTKLARMRRILIHQNTLPVATVRNARCVCVCVKRRSYQKKPDDKKRRKRGGECTKEQLTRQKRARTRAYTSIPAGKRTTNKGIQGQKRRRTRAYKGLQGHTCRPCLACLSCARFDADTSSLRHSCTVHMSIHT